MKNILTIDMEDWYHGLELEPFEWSGCEDRLQRNLDLLQGILNETQTKATFFILGCAAEKFPNLVRELGKQGHEIGTHGYFHDFVYRMTPAQFAMDLKKSIDYLEQIIGNSVKSYRAPFFSITRQSIWALEIMAEYGIECDSSIFPINNYRYGLPDAPRYPHRIKTRSGSLFEIPVSTIRVLNIINIAFTGGFYLRFFPYSLIRRTIQRINNNGQPAMVYLHPWELDPDHPRLDLPKRIKLTHYHNLTSTENKLRSLLLEFDFAPVANVVARRKEFRKIRYFNSNSEHADQLWEYVG